jgi:dolichol kinase
VTPRDWLGLWISLAVIGAVVATSEVLRARGVASDLTRKVVHVGIGTWSIPTLFLFDHALAAIILPGLFVLVNLLIHVTGLLPALQDEDRSNLGTIWFPLSYALLLWIFWEPSERGAAAAGLLAMAWGDASASIVGRRWGRHRYTIGGTRKSLEGSGALVLATAAALVVAGWCQTGGGLSAGWIAAVSLAAAAIEAPCGRGLDNLLLPGGVAALFHLLS